MNETSTWVEAIAAGLCDTPASAVPREALRAASRQTLDTVACALGAVEHEAAEAMLHVVRSVGGAPECSLIGQQARGSILNAVLYNGTLIRALDANDIFFHFGSGGHPSDNIAVALAFAERAHASGLEFLRAVALGYEVYWRLRQDLMRARARGYVWDQVSGSGMVAAAMGGLLLGLEREQLANALALGGAQTYSLAEIRAGEISMLKASANAVAAHTGTLAALLAAEGMSGPPRLFEGGGGLLAAIGAEATDELCETLAGPVREWHILGVAVKPFPSIGTSQSVLAATLDLVRSYEVSADDVDRVEVAFADVAFTHEHLAETARRVPHSRETADHSITFLVAAAIEDGELGPRQYADQRWLQPRTQALMRRVALGADSALNAYAAADYPAAVTIHTRDGRALRREVLVAPGSPRHPLSDEALGEKLRRFAGSALPAGRLTALRERLLQLDAEADMARVADLLRAEG
jgi:2-methylcitrate dehydratase